MRKNTHSKKQTMLYWFISIFMLVSLMTMTHTHAQARPMATMTAGTTYLEIPWDKTNTFGFVRNQSINDIIITETQYGALRRGHTIWLGIEGGISRGWGMADHISIGAETVTIIGCDVMEISQPQPDSHGISIQIIRPSRNPGAKIVFSDVTISGFVFPGQSYNIIVAGDSVVNNWRGFNWHGRRQNNAHGFFDIEPFAIRAFSFVDAEDVLHVASDS